MELTGEWFAFYSDKPIKIVFQRMKEFASSINYFFEESEFDEIKFLFFFENKEMQDLHDELGYNTNLNGKGCFCIEARDVKFNGSAHLIDVNGETDFTLKKVNLCFENATHYFLTLPSSPEDNEFSKKIYHSFSDILKR